MSSPEQKLKRFLHFGREIPVYQPGDRFSNVIYQPSELSSVEALIANEKLADAANCIVKAFSDGYSAHPDMLVYALAVCAKQKTSEHLRESAYKAVKTVCATPENLFLFIKFATKLSPTHSIWGSGCRKVIKDWYLKKDAKTLAEIVSRRKRYHGWSHKDVIKLIHLKAEDPARAAVIKYVTHGIKVAKKDYADNPEATDILSYIQTIEDFKHLTDEQQAARTIETHHLTLDHVPAHLTKSREVWSALVSNLPLKALIKSLERIGYLGLIKPNSPLVTKVIDAVSDEKAIADSHLHPAHVFIALRNYEMSSKFVAAENAQKKQKTENGSGEAKKVVKVPPKPNPKIIQALYDLFATTCKLFLAPTGMRYLVAIDLRSFVPTEKCYRCPHVTPPQAAVVTTLCLLHADRNVAVKVAGANDELVPVALNSSMTIQQGVDKLKETTMHRFTMATPIKWALQKKEEYDVFVLITDSLLKGNNNNHAVNILNQYRTEMKIPNVKLITMSLKCHFEPTWASASNDPGMLDIGGFDGHVPRIIEAFSRGAF